MGLAEHSSLSTKPQTTTTTTTAEAAQELSADEDALWLAEQFTVWRSLFSRPDWTVRSVATALPGAGWIGN